MTERTKETQTTFFEWAAKMGFSIKYLAKRMRYSDRHLRNLKNGYYPITHNFEARVLATFAEEHPEVRHLFFHPVALEGTR